MEQKVDPLFRPLVKRKQADAASARPSLSNAQLVIRKLVKNKLAMLGFVIIVALVAMSIIGPHLVPYSYSDQNLLMKNKPISDEHWFGTDDLGRDMFARTWYGARISLTIGVVAALIMAWTRGALTRQVLRDSVEGTIRTTAMIFLIVTAAMFLNFVLGFLGVTQALTGLLQRYELSPLATMALIVVFYIILGMFMETLSMMLTTVPLVYPVVAYLGFDGVWFGILITLLIELALITPPIGLNLFVVQGIRARGGPFRDVSRGALPFAGTILVMIGLLIAFPGIALWLPGLIY